MKNSLHMNNLKQLTKKPFHLYFRKQFLKEPSGSSSYGRSFLSRFNFLTDAVNAQQLFVYTSSVLKLVSRQNFKHLYDHLSHKSKKVFKDTKRTLSTPFIQQNVNNKQPLPKTPDAKDEVQEEPETFTPDPHNLETSFQEWHNHALPATNFAETIKKDFKKNTSLQDTLFSWINISKSNNKEEINKKQSKLKGRSVEDRTLFLYKSLVTASSLPSRRKCLLDINRHLVTYPEEKNLLIKKGALPFVLRIKEESFDPDVKKFAQQTSTMLGYADAPRGKGVRILSVDGGGSRGLVPLETLRYLEQRTGKSVYELFDYVCGVSTGALLLMYIFAMRRPLDECETLYRTLSTNVFSQNAWLGTTNLLWSHAYYNTTYLAEMLKDLFGEIELIDSSQLNPNLKISCISTMVNHPMLKVFVFRNYALPYRTIGAHPGSFQNKVWEAVRASGAAPGYFEPFSLGDYIHQDGGLTMNNPTALAIHEARLLWPNEPIQCVISLGTGRFRSNQQVVSHHLGTTLMKVIDSATDTEAVHLVLSENLQPHSYYRFNPFISDNIALDECRDEKLSLLKTDSLKYIEWNEHKFNAAIRNLTIPRPSWKKMTDKLKLHRTVTKHGHPKLEGL